MLITISGTPGTGKTRTARALGKMIKARVISAEYLARKYRIAAKKDTKRNTKIIDHKKLARAAEKEAKKGDVIYESHLAHFAKSRITVILRTEPAELAKRLKRRGWSSSKIMENVEAEAIGSITAESRGKIIEIDATGKTAEKVARLIFTSLNNLAIQKRYRPGNIDWSVKFSTYLRQVKWARN